MKQPVGQNTLNLQKSPSDKLVCVEINNIEHEIIWNKIAIL